MEAQENFDGRMVISVRGPITESFFKPRAGRVRWYCEDVHRFLPIEFDLEGTFDIHDKQGIGLSKAISAAIESEGWRDTPSDEIAEIMANGRLKLALLLNTEGGLIHVMNIIRRFIGHVRSRKGAVTAFGRGPVESAGAELFMNGDDDNRFLEDGGHLMFHLTTGTYENRGGRGRVKQAGEHEWGKLCDRLRSKTPESRRAVLEKRIKRAVKNTDSQPDRPIQVSYRNAEEFEWAEISNDLRKKFETVMGFTGIADYGRDSTVDNFFRIGNFTNFEMVDSDRR